MCIITDVVGMMCLKQKDKEKSKSTEVWKIQKDILNMNGFFLSASKYMTGPLHNSEHKVTT